MSELILKFGAPGSRFDLSEEDASAFFEKIEEALDNHIKIQCDFTGVESVTIEFADRCFGQLIEHYTIQEVARIDFKDILPSVKFVIEKSIKDKIGEELRKELDLFKMWDKVLK
jgi:hypothetical protein